MSDKSSRRRLSAVTTSRKQKTKTTATSSKQHRYSSSPSSSSSQRRRNNNDLSSRKQSFKHTNHPCPILKRSSSEPNLWSDGLFLSEIVSDCDRQFESEFDLYTSDQKATTSLNLLFSSTSMMSLNPMSLEDYNKDAKVVVNVIVEGSPGPIRTMVRLGSSVDETIRLVVDKYIKEGRTPKLDGSALSSFELHNSYFSMQSLSRTDAMGEVGSRSFYLRKSKSSQSIEDTLGIASSSSSSERIASITPPSAPTLPRRYIFLPAFLTRKFCKIIRRTRTLWKMLGCLQS